MRGQDFRKCLLAAYKNLDTNKDMINALNVFPVPDGDTGTNMSLTMRSAINEIEKVEEDNVSSLAKALSNGSLMGARGNSGVITSQIFRGFYQGLEDSETLDIETLKNGFVQAYKTAYKAVMKPTEGTILTVIRAMGEFAENNYQNYNDLDKFSLAIYEEGNKVLEQTQEMLPQLKEAGVVDAGGKGLMCLYQGALNYKNIKIIEKKDSDNIKVAVNNKDTNNEDIKFGYCTEFIIQSKDGDYSKLKKQLSEIGDCLLVVKGDYIIKVHIHTNNPGMVLELALKLGALRDIKIDNMRYQHAHRVLDDKAIAEEKEKELKEEEKKYGFIAVSSGSGLDKIFKQFGVDEIISGGQTMNPSTEDIMKAIDKINAENIYIFPNNGNIILSANQARDLSEKNIYVIETKSIPQGFTSLLAFEEENSPEENFEIMTEAIDEVKSGQITYAIKDTEIKGKKIKKDDIIGIVDKEIKAVSKKLNKTALDLIETMVDEDSCLITVYYGLDVKDTEVNDLERKLKRKYDDLDIEIVEGDQPIYYYLISVE